MTEPVEIWMSWQFEGCGGIKFHIKCIFHMGLATVWHLEENP